MSSALFRHGLGTLMNGRSLAHSTADPDTQMVPAVTRDGWSASSDKAYCRTMFRLRTVIAATAGVLLSTLAVAILINTVDTATTGRILATTNASLLLAAVGVLAVGVTIRIARWRLLLPTQHEGARVSVRRLAPPVLVGYLGNVILPARLGEGIRAASVWRREGIGLPEALGSVVVERVLDTAVIGLFGFLSAVWLDAPIWLITGTALVAVVAVLLLAILISGIGSWVASHLAGVGARWPRIISAANRFLRGATVQDPFAVLGAVALTSVAWLLEALIVWLAAASLSIPLDPAGAMAIAAVAVLSTVIPAAPGYVGTYELAASTAGTAIGLPPETALALAVLVHAVTLVPLTIAGLLATVKLGMNLSNDACTRGAKRAS